MACDQKILMWVSKQPEGIYGPFDSEQEKRDFELRRIASDARRKYGVRRPIIEGLSMEETLRMWALATAEQAGEAGTDGN